MTSPAAFMAAAPAPLNGSSAWASLTLPSGHITIIDQSDLLLVEQFKWHALKARRTVYVQTKGSAANGFTRTYLHRLLLGAASGQLVDHRNHNGLDNRRANLRLCSPAENVANSGVCSRNTTGYRGVIRYKDRFRARIGTRSTPGYQHLGYFDDIWDAAQAYNAAAVERYGDFALLNVRQP